MSPVKSIVPIAYSLSWMFDGCSPASPPSGRAHCGAGPIRRTPVRSEWWCTSHSVACSIAMSSAVKKSGAACGPGSTPISHSVAYVGNRGRCDAPPVAIGADVVDRASPTCSTSPATSARPACPPKRPRMNVDARAEVVGNVEAAADRDVRARAAHRRPRRAGAPGPRAPSNGGPPRHRARRRGRRPCARR